MENPQSKAIVKNQTCSKPWKRHTLVFIGNKWGSYDSKGERFVTVSKKVKIGTIKIIRKVSLDFLFDVLLCELSKLHMGGGKFIAHLINNIGHCRRDSELNQYDLLSLNRVVRMDQIVFTGDAVSFLKAWSISS